MEKQPLIIIAGPTATGKSAAAVALAQKLNGEVISADSMQVYRGMDIGSAKITPEEMRGVPHHLIDVLEPEDAVNITIFQRMAKEAMRSIYERGHIPILCGGTGFYIQSVLYDIVFTEEDTDYAYRQSLEKLVSEQGTGVLYDMLRRVDPASCESIHENNVKRVIRALDFYHETGRPISEHNAAQRSRQAAYDFLYFVLTDEREKLYARIDARVEQMVADGLVAEVAALRDRGIPRSAVSMQGLGYKEIYDHLDGTCTLEEAIYTIKRDTRHFAKRQLTWFKREAGVIWLNRSEYADPAAEIPELMYRMVRERLLQL
ncbi:MAG: tRNA (adenosine(37)-N6)-dimethylallyltransferase MiaA [Lachnospiraceae bacterium]|nr:tRNA (adenosine(37)-N6)-dimethylallyltransferase MiaA [Lachnospiraceae bacterium]